MAGMIDIIFNVIQNIQTVLLYGWPFILLVWIFLLKIKWKNWPIEAFIIEKRGSNLIKTNDRAGRYIDAYTGLTEYRLQKSKDTLPVINLEWILHNQAVPTTLFERFVNLIRGNSGTIFLFKYGSKQYKPVIIKTKEGIKRMWKLLKNKDGSAKLISIYEQFDPRYSLGVLDFEVIDWDNMNFMVQEQRASITRRQKKSEFWKQILIPLALVVICGLVCIIMIKFSFDYAMAMSGKVSEEKPAGKTNIPIISNLMPGE